MVLCKNLRFERAPRGRTSKHADTLRILELLGTQTVRATIEDLFLSTFCQCVSFFYEPEIVSRIGSVTPQSGTTI